ncbi:MAG: thioredoxin-disulfide reductase [Candidatus Marsarchaeota archaeon]
MEALINLMDYDVIIVGGGPAGLSAAVYARRANLKTAVIEKLTFGGIITTTDLIENYLGFPAISGSDFGKAIHEHAMKYNPDMIQAEVTSVKEVEGGYLVQSDAGDFTTRTVIVASGAAPKKLGVPGEDKFFGRGVSTCATCDGPFFAKKDVAVVGGGDSALSEGLYLSRLVNKIYLIHRRDKLRAEPILQERFLKLTNVEFVWNSVVTEIKGDKKVNGITVKNVLTGEEKSIDVSAVFVYIGEVPQTSFVDVEKDDHGYIITDQNMQTSKPGIFAAGDCRHSLSKQAIISAGEGALAAIAAQMYIEGRLKATPESRPLSAQS